ncbi:hypothetical protein [Anaeromicropila populeti]|uniref:Uncharacterized protein n=1 Tax=Anaeromicropila populeti TaxID=37658 RepID=A0A1I6JDD5_9FIRM|nr:hypothetical protein [Anaeromicropila populeti]SFR76978.1 hypothetical protein SAMN05661086_01587 [Anaeromicropila populeti]
MENGWNMLFYMFGIFMFCGALSLFSSLFQNVKYFERQVKESMYKQHVISSRVYGF